MMNEQDGQAKQSKLQAIKDKIRKLLSLANRAGTEHEASVAAETAARLLEQYNLERAECEDTGENERPYGTEVLWKHTSNAMPTYMRHLAMACKYLFNIRPVTYTGRRNILYGGEKWGEWDKAFTVASGTPEAIEASRQAIALFNAAIARGYARQTGLKGRSAKASYCLAAAAEIQRRAMKDKEDREQQAKETAPQVYGIVLANAKGLDVYHRSMFPNLTSGRPSTVRDANAYNLGKQDGANIALGRAKTFGGQKLLG